jgi:hypothetical protein
MLNSKLTVHVTSINIPRNPITWQKGEKRKVEMMSNILTPASLSNFLCSFFVPRSPFFFFLLNSQLSHVTSINIPRNPITWQKGEKKESGNDVKYPYFCVALQFSLLFLQPCEPFLLFPAKFLFLCTL